MSWQEQGRAVDDSGVDMQAGQAPHCALQAGTCVEGAQAPTRSSMHFPASVFETSPAMAAPSICSIADDAVHRGNAGLATPISDQTEVPSTSTVWDTDGNGAVHRGDSGLATTISDQTAVPSTSSKWDIDDHDGLHRWDTRTATTVSDQAKALSTGSGWDSDDNDVQTQPGHVCVSTMLDP